MITEREIKLYDNSDMFKVLADFSKQIEEARDIGISVKAERDYSSYKRIIICGMGGSAIGGDLLRSFLQYEIKIPVYVNRNYRLPAFADKDTLVIASSYSGNTEETLSAYEEAKNKGCKIICISSGGKLSLLAQNEGHLLISIPKGYQPRCAIAYSFFPLLILIGKIGFAGDKQREIDSVISRIRKRAVEYSALNEQNMALKIASVVQGNFPVIYSSTDLLDIANLRMRCQVNENAKSLAFGNLLPEMDHNEIVGWENNLEGLKNFVVISLSDKDDLPEIKRRNEITMELIKPLAKMYIEIEGEGESLLERIFDIIYFGDWMSFYLAVLYKTDPTPVEKINYLKSKLTE
jgi:glucose/mannose-6-phosphate isomerase